MDFGLDERTEQLRGELLDFMDRHVYPAEPAFAELDAEGSPRSGWDPPEVMEELKAEARRRGLWNLFYPEASAGGGLSLLSYASLAEVTGRSPLVAPEALNCSAPDTGNMELLHLFATDDQRTRWLEPLLDGRIRSAYCMTEPDVASSDASNLATTIRRDGDDYVIDGRKWWSTGVMARACELLVVVGVTDPDAEPRRRQSVVLVPKDTPGVTVRRGLSVLGYRDASHGGHGEVVFEGVRVPAANLLGGEGRGSEMAQARLGPGRIHHCMRLIGMAERAFDLMCARVLQRSTFGQLLADRDTVQETITEARIRIDSARLLVLRTAWLIDKYGAREARTDISAVKVAVPKMVTWVVDRAMQLHGAGGLSADYPLAMLYAQARGLRLADGPDAVHQMVVARRELARYRSAGTTT
jgi:acyl-CoA dehydrogenase